MTSTPLTAEITWQNVRESDFRLGIPDPVSIGPTWQIDPEWDGDDPTSKYVLPRWTLGWQIADWIHDNLLNDEGEPFRLTPEQARLLLWWYAVDEHGRFTYRQGTIQRLKGWGKDPFGAVVMAVEFVGPCRFAGWAARDMPDFGLRKGDPVAKDNPKAWVQTAGVSQTQTKNSMVILQSIFSDDCKSEYEIDLGKEIIYAYGGLRRIESVTSSPSTAEGNRPSFVLANEVHHWLANNRGHAMARVLRRNLAKSRGGTSRMLMITNAYERGEDSVGETRRATYERAIEQGRTPEDMGVLYDSLEAPLGAHINLPPVKDEMGLEVRKATEGEIKAYVGAIIDAVRGDAHWLDVDRILGEILDGETTVEESRRFYYNQIGLEEDAWLDPDAIDRAISNQAQENASLSLARYDSRWIVAPDEEVVLFLDASKSGDATGLVGCRVSDGHVFTVGVWQRPKKGGKMESWTVPRGDVDARVRDALGRFNVIAFWADPSHAKNDEDGTYFWDEVFDGWHRDYGSTFRKELWSVKSGDRTHSIMWDMTSPQRSEEFVKAAQRFVAEMENLNDIEELEPSFSIDGHPMLLTHLRNARRRMTKWGESLGKSSRSSTRKVDLAVCAVGARMLRRVALNTHKEEPETPNGFWSY